ncbi:hypothetical protein DENSPDRAFT_879498 [Dentipellis sp. KUC8613]|nr:hypothetical protein DENSPDRAFT_879498 [Dentipellis sp. KUC8613]
MCGERYYVSLLVALWVETLLYGLYILLFAISIYVLLYRRPNKYYFSTAVAMFVLTTTYMGIDLARILVSPNLTSGSYYVDGSVVSCAQETSGRRKQDLLWALLQPIEDIEFALNMIVADGLLIFRCYHIWPHTRWVVIPLIIMLLATSACNFVVIHYEFQIYFLRHSLSSTAEDLPQRWVEVGQIGGLFAEAAYALSLATNIFTTVLIASRIWWMSRQSEKAMGRAASVKYRDAIAMVVESGAVYSVSLLINLVVISTAKEYTNIVGCANNLLMSIAPTLIIVRAGMSKDFESVQETLHHASRGFPPGSIRFAENQAVSSDAYALRSTEVVVHRRKDLLEEGADGAFERSFESSSASS